MNIDLMNPYSEPTQAARVAARSDRANPFLWRDLIAGIALALGSAMLATPVHAATVPTNWNVNRLKVVGLTEDGFLVHFKAATPWWTWPIGKINGFDAGDKYLVGMDYRVQNGLLYGVGSGGGIYTINTTNAKLTLVGRLSQPLDPFAQYFGVDFNPAANRMRIISDQGQNLAHNIDDGATAGTTLVNGMLNDPPPAAPGTIAKGVTGAAYTNNDLPPDGSNTQTTLFDIDTVRDQISIQSPPGAGTLTPTGKLGVDTDLAVGFDIYSQIQNGATVANYAFASLRVNGGYGFYSISPLTGKATRIGRFYDPVVDIAIPVKQ